MRRSPTKLAVCEAHIPTLVLRPTALTDCQRGFAHLLLGCLVGQAGWPQPQGLAMRGCCCCWRSRGRLAWQG